MLAMERPVLDVDVLAVCGEEAMRNGGILGSFYKRPEREMGSRVQVEPAGASASVQDAPIYVGDFVR